MFSVFGVGASVRGAAEWAIEQLTEDDINSSVNNLIGGLFGAMEPSTSSGSHRSALDDIGIALGKGPNTKDF